MSTILVKGGRVVDPANGIDAVMDVLIEDGKIKKVSENIELEGGSEAKGINVILNASGKVVCPGFVDIHVHLREPGREDKETIYTASRAAAKGGITSVVAMPNTAPAMDGQTALEYVLSKARKEAIINIFVSGAMSKGHDSKEMAEIWEMKQTGAVCISDDACNGMQSANLYRKVMQYCKTHDMPMLTHAEEKTLSEGGQVHEGVYSSKLGLKGIPAAAEDIATAQTICLVEDVGHQMHFTHVSTKGAIDQIRMAQKKGLAVTADVTPHHFSLTDEAVDGYNTYAKVLPPLRSEDHRQALHEALKEGVVSVIATDHAPHLWTEKERAFQDAPYGLVGFETMLPLVITNLVDKGVLTLSEAIAKMTVNPAKVMRLDKGTLTPGSDADITIFDLEKELVVDRTAFESKGQNSPFHGMTLKGEVTETIVAGKLVLENSKIVE